MSPDPSALSPDEAVLLAVAAKLARRGSLVSSKNLALETGLSYHQAERLRRELRARDLWPHDIPTIRDVALMMERDEGEDSDQADVPDEDEVRAEIAAIQRDWPAWRIEIERRRWCPPVEVRRGRMLGQKD